MNKIIKIIKSNSGQGGLEMLGVMFAWIIMTSLMINLTFFFGAAMLVQSAANRAAIQAGANGCVSNNIKELVESTEGLAATDFVITARYSNRGANQWAIDTTNIYNADGSIDLSNNALCNTRNTVPAGRYITVQITYKQHLLFFNETKGKTVRRQSSVISHNLREPQ